MNFTRRLNALVAEEAKDHKVIASEIGISPASLHNYLNGRLPKVEELVKIAKRFGISIDDLMDWNSAKNHVRVVTSMADALAESYGRDEQEKQELFSRFAELISAVRESSATLTNKLEEMELLTKMLLNRRKDTASSKSPSDAAVVLKRAEELERNQPT